MKKKYKKSQEDSKSVSLPNEQAGSKEVNKTNSPEPVIEQTEPSTINDQPSTENMEVHHPHHLTHKKKWGEYLLEFFMLFLAVFLGFVAENIREHTVEKEREKEYAKLLLADLRTDSTFFVNRTSSLQKQLKQFKAFSNFMKDSTIHSDKQLINAFLPLWHSTPFSVTTGTFRQMENSGSLRYIKNEKLLNLLEHYYEDLLINANLHFGSRQLYSDNIIYPFFLAHIRMQDIDDQADTVTVDNPVFLNRNKETEQMLFNIFANFGSDKFNDQSRYTEPFINANKELIASIKEEYHLK